MIRKKFFCSLAVMLIGSYLGGLTLSYLTSAKAFANNAPDIVRARIFQLVDEQGRTRASLGFDEDKNPVLLFFTKTGNNGAYFGHTSTGGIIQFMDQNGNARLNLCLDEKYEPGIFLMEGTKKIRASLTIGNEGHPFLAFTDHNATSRLMLGLAKGGTPNLMFANNRGTAQLALMRQENYGPGLFLHDENGQPRMAYTNLGPVDPTKAGQAK